MEHLTIVARTFKGLEPILAEEIKEIGGKNIELLKRAVKFTGDLELLYRSNYWLRTAINILVPVKEFEAKTEVDLYDGIRKIEWDKYFDVNQSIAVNTVVNSQYFKHSKYVAYKTKDAIVDYFKYSVGKRPSVNVIEPDVKLFIYISENHCVVNIDSSGELLHKRGYKKYQGEAPLNEVLAAGMIKLTGWNGQSPLIDPMCGSGTILTEAALIALNIPPGIYRSSYGFEKWKNFDQELLDKILDEEIEEKELEHPIYGFDKSKKAVAISTENIKNASLNKKISVEAMAIEELKPPVEKGLIITNPPYGERIVKNNINAFYRNMGDAFKQRFAGFDIWILSGNMDALKNLGLRTSRRLDLLNGQLQCKYVLLKMYEGSMKKSKQNPESNARGRRNTGAKNEWSQEDGRRRIRKNDHGHLSERDRFKRKNNQPNTSGNPKRNTKKY